MVQNILAGDDLFDSAVQVFNRFGRSLLFVLEGNNFICLGGGEVIALSTASSYWCMISVLVSVTMAVMECLREVSTV